MDNHYPQKTFTIVLNEMALIVILMTCMLINIFINLTLVIVSRPTLIER